VVKKPRNAYRRSADITTLNRKAFGSEEPSAQASVTETE